jgi:hypothetical protein
MEPVFFTPHFRNEVDIELIPYDLTLVLHQAPDQWELDGVKPPLVWPHRLTKAVAQRLIIGIELGASYLHAAQAAGITLTMYQNWQRHAQEKVAPFFYLFEQLELAEGIAVQNWLLILERAALIDAKWAAWKLERRHPDQYGSKQNTTTVLKGDPEAPVETRQKLTADDASSIFHILQSIGAVPAEFGSTEVDPIHSG